MDLARQQQEQVRLAKGARELEMWWGGRQTQRAIILIGLFAVDFLQKIKSGKFKRGKGKERKEEQRRKEETSRNPVFKKTEVKEMFPS